MKYLNFITWIIPPLTATGFFLFVNFLPSNPFSDPLWEIVHTPNSSAKMMRTSVPHGWLVTYKNLARSIVYIPDEKHEWKIK